MLHCHEADVSLDKVTCRHLIRKDYENKLGFDEQLLKR
jgi:hypothetical protein